MLPNETHPHENKIHYADMSAPKEYLLKHIQKTQVLSNINQIQEGGKKVAPSFSFLLPYFSITLRSSHVVEDLGESWTPQRERKKNNDLEKRDEK